MRFYQDAGNLASGGFWQAYSLLAAYRPWRLAGRPLATYMGK